MSSSANYNAVSLLDFVGGLFFGSSEQGNTSAQLDLITRNIAVSTRYRTPLLQMQQNAEIPKILLGFAATQKSTPNNPVPDEKAAYMAMRLGFKLLSTVLASYDKDKQKIGDFLLACSKKPLNEVPELEGRSEEDEYDKQVECEVKTFLKFYTILKKGDKLTPAKEIQLSEFFKSARSSEIEKNNHLMETDRLFQQKFFDYYVYAKDKEAFERSLQAVFHYSKQAARDARHQGLLEAAQVGPDVLRAFMELYRGDININQHFFSQEPVPGNTKTGKPVLARTVIEHHGIQDINEIIKILCKEGADIHFVLPDVKMNLLHFAVNSGLWSAIPLLIEKGVKADQCDSWGCTPLNTLVDKIHEEFTAYRGNKDNSIRFINDLEAPLKALISKETINKIGTSKRTLLDERAIYHATPFFKLVVYLSRVFDLTSPQEMSKLDFSIIELLKFFVKEGADLNTQDALGYTILHYLADSTRQGGYGGLVITEVEARPWIVTLMDVSTEEAPLKIKKNKNEETPKEIALRNGNKQLAKVIEDCIGFSHETRKIGRFMNTIGRK